jgi:hypothetical protein
MLVLALVCVLLFLLVLVTVSLVNDKKKLIAQVSSMQGQISQHKHSIVHHQKQYTRVLKMFLEEQKEGRDKDLIISKLQDSLKNLKYANTILENQKKRFDLVASSWSLKQNSLRAPIVQKFINNKTDTQQEIELDKIHHLARKDEEKENGEKTKNRRNPSISRTYASILLDVARKQ